MKRWGRNFWRFGVYFLTGGLLVVSGLVGCATNFEKGWEANKAGKYQEAHSYYIKAVQDGNGYAMNNLGVLYAKGRGVPEDETKAVYWYQKAAQAGNSYGMSNLAWSYRWGRGGNPQDQEQAFYWYGRSWKAGNSDARKKLYAMDAQRARQFENDWTSERKRNQLAQEREDKESLQRQQALADQLGILGNTLIQQTWPSSTGNTSSGGYGGGGVSNSNSPGSNRCPSGQHYHEARRVPTSDHTHRTVWKNIPAHCHGGHVH